MQSSVIQLCLLGQVFSGLVTAEYRKLHVTSYTCSSVNLGVFYDNRSDLCDSCLDPSVTVYLGILTTMFIAGIVWSEIRALGLSNDTDAAFVAHLASLWELFSFEYLEGCGVIGK